MLSIHHLLHPDQDRHQIALEQEACDNGLAGYLQYPKLNEYQQLVALIYLLNCLKQFITEGKMHVCWQRKEGREGGRNCGKNPSPLHHPVRQSVSYKRK